MPGHADSPLEFVSEVGGKGHVVLLYEDRDYAERIQFRFLKDGLEKGESCLITTHGQTRSLVERMNQSGIPVWKYSERGKLHVLGIPDPMAHPRGPDQGVREIYDKIFGRVSEPFRIVSTTFKEPGDPESYSKEVQLERTAQRSFDGQDEKTRHDVFKDMKGTVMCTYAVDQFPADNKEWLKELLSDHHAAIFAPRSGAGVGMDLRPIVR